MTTRNQFIEQMFHVEHVPPRFEDQYPQEAAFLSKLFADGWNLRWVLNRFGILTNKSIAVPFKHKVDSAA